MSSYSNTNIHHIDPALWKKANERSRLVNHLYKRGKHLSKIEVEEVADSLGLSLSYVYKLLKRFLINPKTSSLLPKIRGWSTGKSRLTEKQEAISFLSLSLRRLMLVVLWLGIYEHGFTNS